MELRKLVSKYRRSKSTDIQSLLIALGGHSRKHDLSLLRPSKLDSTNGNMLPNAGFDFKPIQCDTACFIMIYIVFA